MAILSHPHASPHRRSSHDGYDQTLSWERSPSSDGVTEGQYTFYDYPGKDISGRGAYAGTNSLPSLIAQKLPDGTTRYEYFERNQWGLPTMNVSTYMSGTNVLQRTNTFVYGANGRDLIHHYGPVGTTPWQSFSYTADHQVEKATNRLGEVTSYTYNSANKAIASIAYPNGLLVSNVFYPSGFTNFIQSKTLKQWNSSTNYGASTYDYSKGKVSTGTTIRGLAFTNYWDDLQRLIGRGYPEGSISNIYTLPGGQINGTGGTGILDLTGTKDMLGHWTYFVYDGLRHLVNVTNALNNVTTYGYCDCGLLSSIQNALSDTTYFNYDAAGRLTNIVDGANQQRTFRYDLVGRMINSFYGTNPTNAPGSVTNYYNHQDLLVLSSNAFGQALSVTYNIEDEPATVVNRDGTTVTYTYDELRRLRTRTYPDTGAETFTYTPTVPGVASYQNQVNNTAYFLYDALGRVTSQIVTNYSTSTFGYTFRPSGGVGESLVITDPNSHSTTLAYDGYARLTQKKDHNNSTVLSLNYYPTGWVSNRTDGLSRTTTYSYNAVGSLTNVNYPNSADLTFGYDAVNRLTSMIDAIGTTAFAYAPNGLLQSEDGPWSSDTIAYGYTNYLRKTLNLQQPSGASDWTQTYSYDTALRLTDLVSPASSGFHYHYPVAGNTLATTSGRFVSLGLTSFLYITNQFDNMARLTGSAIQYDIVPGTPEVYDTQSYEYTQANQRSKETRVAQDFINYTYGTAGQLISALATNHSGGVRPHEQFRYLYDAAGNLTTRTNNAFIESFTPNALNELTGVSHSGTGNYTLAGGVTDFGTLTINGSSSGVTVHNDLSFSQTGVTLTNGNNSFTAVMTDGLGRKDTNTVNVSIPNSISLSYDGNGNLTSDSERGFTYDDENQLTQIVVTNKWKSNFSYDGLGRRRVRQEYNWVSGNWSLASETRYVYDGMLVIQERDGSNARKVSYTRGLDQSGTLQGAGGVGGLIARTDHNSNYGVPNAYYFQDGNGNVRTMVNSQQQVVARYLYDPYGGVIAQSGFMADQNVYQFSGKEAHLNSGLVYYGYRYYEPNFQRWINRDPIGEAGGLNLYGMVGNDPVNLVDSFGLHWTDYIPDWIGGLFDYEGPTSTPGFGPAPPSMTNLGMLKDELGGYDDSQLQAVKAGVEAVASIHPASRFYNSAFTACTKKDALDPSKEVGTASQVEAAAQAGGELLGMLTPCLNGVQKGANIALGSRYGGLRTFASDIGADHLLDVPSSSWKNVFQSLLNDPSTKFNVSMNGFFGGSPAEMILNEINSGSNTGWELQQILQAGKLPAVNFYDQAGNLITNPFK